VDLAAALGHPVIVVDGLLQATPGPLAAGILVLDALAPWGAGSCPPLGDLRAPRAALLGAADQVVAIQPEGAALGEALPPGTLVVPGRIAGAVPAEGAPVPLRELRSRRLGLILAVARPHRVVEALEREGIHPAARLILGDHAVPGPRLLRRAARAPVDAWLTTARCATKIPGAIGGRPVLALDHRVDVGALVERLPC
jgi:tetraacyldisaccharide 4'-kinase